MTPDDPYSSFLESYVSQQEAPAQADEAEDVRPGEWRTVWTWIELVDGEVLPASLEILGRAREIADELGTRSCAVVVGHELADAPARLGEYGADRVYVVDHPTMREFHFEYALAALRQLVEARRPEAVLFPATIQGRNLAAQIAAAQGTGVVPNCRALRLDPSDRLLVGEQTSFEERLVTDIAVPVERPQVFTVTPGRYRRPPRDAGRQAQVTAFAPEGLPEKPRVRVLGPEPDPARPPERYDAVVGAGLGVASKEGFQLALTLAKRLDAYAGATRGAIACGWAEEDRLISDTRQRLRPRLYVACGVVGEYDHLKAIEDADLVVALTQDANLPMVENADLVGVGDPAEILRRLVEHIEEAQRDRMRIP